MALIAPDSFLSKLHADDPFDFTFRGVRYKSITHFIYASLMPDIVSSNGIRNEPSADLARKKALSALYGKKTKTGRKLAFIAEKIIRSALKQGYLAKFAAGIYNTKLVNTGDEEIVYSLYRDTFLPEDTTVLGVNQNQNGQNYLGKILQEVRTLVTRYKTSDPLQVIADRFTQIYLRRQYLLDELNNGIFPFDYSYQYFEKLRSPDFNPDQRMNFYRNYLRKKEKYHAEMDSAEFYGLLQLFFRKKLSIVDFENKLSDLLQRPKNSFLIKVHQKLKKYDFSISSRLAEVEKLLEKKDLTEDDLFHVTGRFVFQESFRDVLEKEQQSLEIQLKQNLSLLEEWTKIGSPPSIHLINLKFLLNRYDNKEIKEDILVQEIKKIKQDEKSLTQLIDQLVPFAYQPEQDPEFNNVVSFYETLYNTQGLTQDDLKQIIEVYERKLRFNRSEQELEDIQQGYPEFLASKDIPFNEEEKESLEKLLERPKGLVKKEVALSDEFLQYLIERKKQKLSPITHQNNQSLEKKRRDKAVAEMIDVHYLDLKRKNLELIEKIRDELKRVDDFFTKRPSGDILSATIRGTLKKYRQDPQNFEVQLIDFLGQLYHSVDPELQVYRYYLEDFQFDKTFKESQINREILRKIEKFEMGSSAVIQLSPEASSIQEIDDLVKEFEFGDSRWIEREYDLALLKYALLQHSLFEKGIDVKTLIISLARNKVLQDYMSFRYDVNGKEISLPEFLQGKNIDLPLLEAMGSRLITPLRDEIYQNYNDNFASIPFGFKQKVAEIFQAQKHQLLMNLTFKKYIPQIDDSIQKMMRKDEFLIPIEPEETYGEQTLIQNYETVQPQGACSEEETDVCPAGITEDEEEINENDGIEEEETFNGDSFDLDAFLNEKLSFDDEEEEEVEQKRKISSSAIRVGDENFFPYEWMAPFHLSEIIIDDVSYPSVGHYVIACLSYLKPVWHNIPRPKLDYSEGKISNSEKRQYAEIPPLRKWIQKNPHQVGSGIGWKLSLDSYRSVSEMLKFLPRKLQENIQELYIRMAVIGFSRKMSSSPYRQILYSTLPQKIEYLDPDNLNRDNSVRIGNILEKIRAEIKDVVLPERRVGVYYDAKNFPNIALYIYNRITILAHTIFAFAKFKLTHPKIVQRLNLPGLSFDDIDMVRKLILSCYQCRYLDDLSSPPDNFKTDCANVLSAISKLYFPGVAMQNLNERAMKEVVQKFTEQRDVTSLSGSFFYNFEEVQSYFWSHINQMVEALTPEKLDDNLFAQNLKTVVEQMYNRDLGTKVEVAINAILNLLSMIRSYTREDCTTADLNLIRNLLFRPASQYPIEVVFDQKKGYIYSAKTYFPEEDNYQKYGFVDQINQMYQKELPLKILKQVGGLIREILAYPEGNEKLFTEFAVRLKFFADPE